MHAIVAEFADRCRRLGEQAQQTVGNARHRPGRRGALPYIAPEQPFVADSFQFSPKYSSGEDAFAALRRLVDRKDPSYRL